MLHCSILATQLLMCSANKHVTWTQQETIHTVEIWFLPFFMLMWMLLDVKIPTFNLILLNSILFYSVPIYPHVPFVFLQATFETVCISDPNFRWQFDCSQFCLFIYLITFHQSVEKMGLLIKNHDDFQRYDQAIWESFCPEGMADVKLRSECRLCRFISHNHQN